MQEWLSNITDGEKFGYLTLTGKYEVRKNSHVYVECRCVCGALSCKRYSEIKKGTTKSCGSKSCRLLDRAIKINKDETFGRLTLTGFFVTRDRVRFVEANCSCGTTGYYRFVCIRQGVTRSCGCLQRDIASKGNATHGLTRSNKKRHPIHNTWCGIKQRCFNPSALSYERYGGRGISVDEEWTRDFNSFYKWSIENGWQRGLSLDRIENDKGYFPSNCRWATVETQAQNRRSVIELSAFGEKKCLSAWARDSRCPVSVSSLKQRIGNGWAVERAISAPPTHVAPKKQFNILTKQQAK